MFLLGTASIAARLRRFAGDARGAVAVIGALSLTTLVGMGAFAVEISRGYAADTANQRIADMAALAGALAYNVNNNTTQMAATAKAVVAAQGLPASAATVSLVTDAATSKQLVQVSVTTAVPLALGRVFTSALSYDVTAVGSATTTTVTTSSPPCIAALSATPSNGISLSGGVSIMAPGCAINTNAGVSITNGPTITAKQVNAGKTISGSGGIITSPTANNFVQNKANAASDWMSSNEALKAALCQVNKLTGTSDTDYADGNTACISAKVLPTTPTASSGATWSLGYEAKGTSEPGKYLTGGWTCVYNVPAGTYTLDKIIVPGGCEINFASGSTIKVNSIEMNGRTMTIGDGDLTVVGDFKVNADNPITIGNGNHSFGSLTILGGKKLNVGSGNFNLSGGVSVSGGAYLKVAVGVGNSVVIGKDGSGNSINVGGGSQVCFTADCTVATAAAGIFSADGNILNTGGGSLIVFTKSVNHIINGNLSLASGAIFSPGLYVVAGNFTNGTGDPMRGTDITIAMGGTFAFAGGATLDLAAPTGTSSYGVPGVLFATKSAAATSMSAGAGGKYSGLLYAPKSAVSLSGGTSMSASGGSCMMMIVSTLTLLEGGTTNTGSCSALSGSGSSSTPNVALFK